MAATMLFAGLVKRRAILRVFLAAASVLLLVGAFAFSATVAVLGASAADTPPVCSQDGAAGQPAANGASALSIRASSQAPVSVTARQMAVAGDYVSIGQQLGVPRDGQIIAIMMALQESSLRVLANVNVPASLGYPHDGLGSDHDSLGTAQQRPAAGWGTVEELMDPKYNVRAFYGGPAGPNHGSPPGLLDIRGWQSMNTGQAAQAVQVSAFPELYARWEAEATAIVETLDGGTVPAVCEGATNSSSGAVAPTNLSEIRKDILRFTQDGVGGAYVWGGTAYKAWDCSGYVQWIYRQAGVNLPRVEQWRVGSRTDNPQPGDLVVQNAQGPNNWGHVGIYAGDGMMYSALNPAVGTLLHPVAWNTDTAYFDLLT
ncbi:MULTISPECIES: C40 family peptidase [unclassified Arthrobacter]|uniref:C40 family peptidase n=1 Tax=unclassified Arthrobacter TaxID=235627 RepID=UPI002DFC6264|nr:MULTISPECIES: NlpC/P60 family protein [unclassified Arthrobacter]MEC5193463.1 cell wall-associated NlpC family hydrolase [Arthrobacter sp. MP_M4]MEC5204939.1 cell wall-associated NlpC family hydrolase [Arthrobacter sp. MP_M7]